MSTISAREFNRDVSAAKRAADHGPVFITDRGVTSHVLMSAEEYRTLVGHERSLADSLAMDDHVDFEPGVLDFDPKVPEL